jgi:hypothetical protein
LESKLRLDGDRQKRRTKTMSETTKLIVAGNKLSVPRLLKRVLQIVIAVALTSAVFFTLIVGNGFLVGRGTTLQAGFNAWLAFIRRSEILTTMVLTAAVSILLVYWQRDRERGAGGRPPI